MISTKPSRSATFVDTKKTTGRVIKPQVVLDYNKGKQGIDLSDQLSTYYTCHYRSKKWYQKVAFEMIFGMLLVSVYLIYKESYDTTSVIMLEFRETLVWSLLLGVQYENLKPGPRKRSTSQMKCKLEEKEVSTLNIGRWCTGCYAKRRAQQSREASMQQQRKQKLFALTVIKFLS